ncbi:MAG TPA: glycosyltransferase family 2 protein [Pyrinomonadaceae bacterium]
MAVELSIIIVNWNGGELLRRSVESVLEAPPAVSYEIIVVDNASTDGSLQWLRNCGVENLRLIENAENLGFGKGNNQAFAATDAPLLFLLNSDAEVRPGAIDTLIATITSGERIGVCGPRLINPDGTLQASVWNNPVTPFEMIAGTLRLYKLLPRRLRGEMLLGYHWDHASRREAQMLSGAALLVKKKMVTEVGGFDERFHMYGEDTEWCLRIVRSGWLMIFEPAATVMHHGGQSSSKRWNSLEKQSVESKAFFRFQRYCLSRRQIIANLFTGYCLTLMQHIWHRLRGQPIDRNKLVLKLYSEELKQVLWNKRLS